MTPQDALSALKRAGDPAKVAAMAAYHKAPRRYLGVTNPQIDDLVAEWRAACTLEARLDLAEGLWTSDIHEARIAAAKLLTQARIRPDDRAWALIGAFVPQFDAWAIADHVCIAGQKRLVADPSRLDEVEEWTAHPLMWARRAALVMTLPWAKMNHPKPEDSAARDRILTWAGGYAGDPDWFMQKVVAWWIRDLSKHDAALAQGFLNEHGEVMKSWARKEASQYLPPPPSLVSQP